MIMMMMMMMTIVMMVGHICGSWILTCICPYAFAVSYYWAYGSRTRPPCAVERDALTGRGSTRPGRVRLPKNYF